VTSLDALNEDFRDFLRSLVAEGVEFLVVGAYALAFHGVPRATGDIDILVRPNSENAARVIRALVRFGAPFQAAGVAEADFARPGIVYQIGLPPRRIDVLTEISGVDFDEAWSSRVSAAFDEAEVCFLGRLELIRNKRSAGRAKDLADADSLES
jgi:hypothetical protein